MSACVVQHPTDWPLYWFAKLDKAVQQGDHESAAEAQKELRRLGVRVNYGCPRKPAVTSRERNVSGP